MGELLRGSGSNTVQVVGVVGSVQQRRAGWGNFGPVRPVPNLYVPAAQVNDAFLRLVHTWFSPSWVVRIRDPPPMSSPPWSGRCARSIRCCRLPPSGRSTI